MTNPLIKQLKEHLSQGTPGPWEFKATGIDYGFVGSNGEETVLFGEQYEGAVRHDNLDAQLCVFLVNNAPTIIKQLTAYQKFVSDLYGAETWDEDFGRYYDPTDIDDALETLNNSLQD